MCLSYEIDALLFSGNGHLLLRRAVFFFRAKATSAGAVLPRGDLPQLLLAEPHLQVHGGAEDIVHRIHDPRAKR